MVDSFDIFTAGDVTLPFVAVMGVVGWASAALTGSSSSKNPSSSLPNSVEGSNSLIGF
jgi:hypothetical protein